MKGGCGGLTGQQVTGVPMNQVVSLHNNIIQELKQKIEHLEQNNNTNQNNETNSRNRKRKMSNV